MTSLPEYSKTSFKCLALIFRLFGALTPLSEFRHVYRFCAFVTYFFVNILNPLTMVLSIYHESSMQNVIRGLPVLCGMFAASVKFVNTYRCARTLLGLEVPIRTLEDGIRRDEDASYMVGKIRTVWRLSIFLIADASFIVLMATFSILISGKRDTLFSAWFPFDWRHSDLTFYLILVFQTCATLMIVWQDCLNEGYPVFFNCLIIGHLQLLNNRFARIGYDLKKSQEENHGELIRCIVDYNLIVKIVKQVQGVVKYVYLFELFIMEIIICTNAFYLSTAIDNIMGLHVICFLVAIFYILGVSCYFGSELQHKSQLLTSSIYACNWIDQSQEFKKDLFTMMIRSQKKMQLLAGGCVEMSLATFWTVIKTAYSMFALLRHFKY